MKKYLAIAAACTLAACGPSDENLPQAVEEEVPAAADVPDGGPLIGSYMVTEADGATYTWINNADGTFTQMVEGEEPVSGTYTMAGREYCYDPDGEEMGETCLNFDDAAEDGSWVSNRPDGSTATVIRIAEEEGADESGEAEAAE